MIMTFRIPNAILGGLWCLLLPRENLAATWRQAVTIFLAFAAATVYLLLGMMLFRGYTITYFFWVVGTLYLIFFVMRTATNYGAAAAFSLHIGFSLPLWDGPLPSEAQVAGTLWVTGAIALGLGSTVLVEAIYRDFDRSDPLIMSINDQLLVTQRVVESIADRRAIPEVFQNKVLQYEMVGTGRLRTTLARQGLDPIRRAHRSALISMVWRLIELAAELQRRFPLPTEEEADRLRKVSERLEEVRKDLRQSQVPAPCALSVAQPSDGVPILPEMERIVDLIIDIFHRGESDRDFAQQRGVPSQLGLLVPDAFQNPEYLRFALAGCISASLCYVLYNALDWPGTSISVLTCIITALTTIGTSVQKQFSRLAGFTIGSLIIGIPAQIFIFPNIDTIFGFTLFFAACTALAAWFATSSPRLSFVGLQIALAFYFITLLEFQIPTDLTITRDRLLGVLIGILAMGFIFDRFGTKSDVEAVRKQFSQILRLLARLAVCSTEHDRSGVMPEFQRLNSQINDSFINIASLWDSVQFELGYRPNHEKDIIERKSMQRAHPFLRWIYVLELSLVGYRDRMGNESALTQQQNEVLNLFLQDYSNSLTNMAAWREHKSQGAPAPIDDIAQRLQQAFQEHISSYSPSVLDICERMVIALHALQEADSGS